MPSKIALKVRISMHFPLADSSPGAFNEAINRLRTLQAHADELGFRGVTVTTQMGNVRAAPTGGQSGGAGGTEAPQTDQTDPLKNAMAEVDKAEARGEFGQMPGTFAKRGRGAPASAS